MRTPALLSAILVFVGASLAWAAPATISQTSETFKTARGLIPGYYGSRAAACLYPYHNFSDGFQLDHSWTKVVLENDFLRVDVLPGLGGRILRMVNKTTGNNEFFDNPAGFKQSPWGRLKFPATGGVEFMMPLDEHHGPFYLPFTFAMEDYNGGVRLTQVFDEDTIYPSGENNRFRLTLVLTLPDDEAALHIETTVRNENADPQWLMYWANAITAPGPGNILYNPRTNTNQHLVYPKTVNRVYNHNDNGNTGDIFGDAWNVLDWPVHAGRDISVLETFHINGFGWMGTFVPKSTPVTHCGVYNRTADEGVMKVFPAQIRPGVNSGAKFFHWGSKSDLAPLYSDGNSTMVEMMTGPVTVFDEPVDCTVDNPHSHVDETYAIQLGGGEQIAWTDTYMAPRAIGDAVYAERDCVLNLVAPSSVSCSAPFQVSAGVYPTSNQDNATVRLTLGGVVVYQVAGLDIGPGAAPFAPFRQSPMLTVDNVPTGAQPLVLTFVFDGGRTVSYAQTVTVNGPCGPVATSTPTDTPDPNATSTPTSTPSATPTSTPVGCPVTECFEAMPAWDSQFESTWGSGTAVWSIDDSGVAGRSLRATRSSDNSAVRVKRYPVNPNHDYRVEIHMKTDATYTSCFWVETAVRPGIFSAEDFDANNTEWTLVHKISSNCAGGAGGEPTWGLHSTTFNAGSNSFVSVGFKIGRSGGSDTIAANWDQLDLVDLSAQPTSTPTPTLSPTPAYPSILELR